MEESAEKRFVIRNEADLSAALREARGDQKAFLAQASKRSGISVRMLNRLERGVTDHHERSRGRRVNPKLDTLLALSRGYGIPIIIDGRERGGNGDA